MAWLGIALEWLVAWDGMHGRACGMARDTYNTLAGMTRVARGIYDTCGGMTRVARGTHGTAHSAWAHGPGS